METPQNDLDAEAGLLSSHQTLISSDPDYFGNFPPEAIEIAKELWSVPLPSFQYYRLCWKLRSILEDNEVLRSALHSTSLCYNITNDISENPNIYRPLFRGISEGLSHTKRGMSGVDSISDYELFHGIRKDADYEYYSNRLEIDSNVLRQRWISLRSSIKRKQDHILLVIKLRPSSWINIMIVYACVFGFLLLTFIVSARGAESLSLPDDPFIVVFYIFGGISPILWIIDLTGSYYLFYVRNDKLRFWQDIRWICIRYSCMLILFVGCIKFINSL